MKIGTAPPTQAAWHAQETLPKQQPAVTASELPPATAQAPLDLVVRPRGRGIHPFLAVTLGDKGCACSSSVQLQSDPSTAARLDDFLAAGRNINRDNICVGLCTEWLLMGGSGDAQSRLDQLDYGSRGQDTGAQRQQLYMDVLAKAFATDDPTPVFTANSATLEDAGFTLRREPKTVRVAGGSLALARAVAADVAQAGRKHMLSLRFESAQGHAIVCSCEGGQFRLFDPNLGEYQCSRREASALFRALIDHYNDLNYDVACMNEYRIA